MDSVKIFFAGNDLPNEIFQVFSQEIMEAAYKISRDVGKVVVMSYQNPLVSIAPKQGQLPEANISLTIQKKESMDRDYLVVTVKHDGEKTEYRQWFYDFGLCRSAIYTATLRTKQYIREKKEENDARHNHKV